MNCAEISFMVNVLDDRGINHVRFLNRYYEHHKWCSHCISMTMRRLYYVDRELEHFSHSHSNYNSPTHTFPMSAEQLAAIMKYRSEIGGKEIIIASDMTSVARSFARVSVRSTDVRSTIDIGYLSKYVPLTREYAIDMLQNHGIYQYEMREFVTNDELRARLVRGIYSHLFEIDHNFPDFEDATTLGMIIAEWRGRNMSHDDIAEQYDHFYSHVNLFPREAVEIYRADLLELFPLLVLISNMYDNVMDVTELCAETCPLDLADRIMAYSDFESYKSMVHMCMNDFIEKYTRHDDHVNNIARLIITKHTKYLECLFDKSSAKINATSVFTPTLTLPEYNSVQLLLDNVAQNYLLLDYLPQRMYRAIGFSQIDEYIHANIMCSYRTSDPDIIYTLFDLIQINEGIKFDDITDQHLAEYIYKILNNALDTTDLEPKNECGRKHIVEIARQNMNIINELLYDDVISIMPLLYDEFWCRMRVICKLAQKRGLPQDITDLIKMFYIKPNAADSDIARMLSATKCE
jgi:hypothetical protein